jgi:uncharacterized protein (DUF58 family)
VILENKVRRRWFGALSLLAAILMLVAEDRFLKNRLTGLAALAFWLGCFGFTVIAICVAFVDLRAVRVETQKEHRALFERTLQRIEEEKRGSSQSSSGSKGK